MSRLGDDNFREPPKELPRLPRRYSLALIGLVWWKVIGVW